MIKKIMFLAVTSCLLTGFGSCQDLQKRGPYFFGLLHSHTGLSDGEGTPAQAFAYARDVGGVDFFAVTDHSHFFDHDLDWKRSVAWANLCRIADEYNEDGKFVAIAGFEMTWNDGTGHINTFNTPWFESRNNPAMNLPAYYEKLASCPDSISQWNHPGRVYGDFREFAYYSAAIDKVVHLIEIASGDGPVRGPGYYPSYEYYFKALDKGWHVAPAIGQDNHRGDWATANEARTVVLAESLTRASLYESIRKLRVYATEDRNLRLMYMINGQIMGSTLSAPGVLNIYIEANDPDMGDNIAKIDLIADGGEVVMTAEFSSARAVWKIDQLNYGNKKYYVVRVEEADGDLAYSAPIWFN